jgi:hypothetical protein
MRRSHPCLPFQVLLVLLEAMASLTIVAQDSSLPNTSGVPRQVRLAGVLNKASGQPLNGIVAISFTVYSQPTGGSGLWQETQNIRFSDGHYSAFLGQNTSTGIPAELISAGQTRWLGVRILLPNEQEHPRVELASIPYPLKAGGTDTVGVTNGKAAAAVAANSGVRNLVPLSSQSVTTSVGTVGAIPEFHTTSDLENSPIFDVGGKIGIGTSTPTSTLNVASSGVFTNTQMNEYSQSVVNAPSATCSPSTEFASVQGPTRFATEASTGCVALPADGAVVNATGVAGYANTSSASGNLPGLRQSHAVGGYFSARCLVSNSLCAGANPVVIDTAITNATGIHMNGLEVDTQPQNPPIAYAADTGIMSSIYSPQNAAFGAAFEAGAGGPAGVWGSGYVVSTGALGNSQSNPAFMVFPGCVATSVANCPTPRILRALGFYWNGSSGVNSTGWDLNQAMNSRGMPTFDNLVLSHEGGAEWNTSFMLSYKIGFALGHRDGTAGVFRTPDSPGINYDWTVPAANGTVGLSLNATNGIYQSKRGVVGCTTAASVGGICAAGITVSWQEPFADADYSVSCTPSGVPTNLPGAPYIASKAQGWVIVNYFSTTAMAASWEAIDCIAVHD